MLRGRNFVRKTRLWDETFLKIEYCGFVLREGGRLIRYPHNRWINVGKILQLLGILLSIFELFGKGETILGICIWKRFCHKPFSIVLKRK